jgi:protein SCO1/2
MKSLRKFLRILIFFLGAVVLVLGILGYALHKKGRGTVTANFGPAPAFQLTTQMNQPLSHTDLAGKPWVASFIFTRCQGPCPLISFRASELQKEFLSSPLQLVSFSVDPDYDTPERMLAYSKTYNADPQRWYFLTGEKKKVFDLIRQGFHLTVEDSDPPSDNDILHSTYFILVDRNNQIRGYYNSTDLEAMSLLRKEIKKTIKS